MYENDRVASNDRFSITVQRQVRPLRFAFAVDPEDNAAVRRAFEISTILWGGRFNALIPVFRNAPRHWPPPSTKRGRSMSALDAANGYLAAFEPDYVVEVGDSWRDGLTCPTYFRKKDSDLPTTYREQEDVLGLTVNSLFAEEYGRRQQFVQKEPVRAVIATFDGYDLLSAATFGAFSEAHQKTREHYARTFSAESITLGATDLWDFLRTPPLTPLRAGVISLSFRWYTRLTLFFCDPSSAIDIIDLWNLRALGWVIFPVPEGWADSSACERFIDSYEGDGGLLILKSHASSWRKWHGFVGRLQRRDKEKLLIRDTLPPIWTPRLQRDDGTWRLGCHSSEDEIELTVEGGAFRLPVASPRIAPDDRWAWTHHWANDIEISSPWDEERAAKLPQLRDVSNVVAPYGERDVSQVSDGSLTVRVKHRRERKFWSLPRYEQVVQEWTRDRSVTIELSSAGRVAQQIIRSFGALRLTWWIANVGLIEYLNRLAHTDVETSLDIPSGSRAQRGVRVGTATRQAIIDRLIQVAQERHEGRTLSRERFQQWADRHLKFLLDHSVLRVGLKIQCPQCSQRNWFQLPDLAEVLRCERCLQSFPFPVAQPREAAWEYRPIGPFAVENYAQGSYAAVLALRFLSFDSHGDAIWIPAFVMSANELSLECDFGALLRQHIGSGAFTFVVGECKTGNRRFLDKDFRACKTFAETFHGGAFVFVTTRRELDLAERRSIAALARRGWKLMDGRWRTPVIILTARELEAEMAATQCWKTAPEAVVEEYRNDYKSTDMERLARATQRLYLDLSPPTVAQ